MHHHGMEWESSAACGAACLPTRRVKSTPLGSHAPPMHTGSRPTPPLLQPSCIKGRGAQVRGPAPALRTPPGPPSGGVVEA